MKRTFALAALFVTLSGLALAADCSPQADEVNARCYPSLQDAAAAALASDRPLVLPKGTYRLAQPLVIDYTAHAATGFELISRGAVIDGTGVQGPALSVTCAGDCFYFHQEGTLFVNANSAGYAVVVGKPDLSDAHNSIKFEHLVVNNAGAGGAVQLNSVLNADLFIVADSAGSTGLALEQLQFSRLMGAASAGKGNAMVIERGYTFANTVTALDLEASPVCLNVSSAVSHTNAFVSTYINCPVGVTIWPGAGPDAEWVNGPMFGGDVRTQYVLLGQWD
jgi:hypothetical protein